MTLTSYDLDKLPDTIPFEVDATHKHISWIAAFILYLSMLGTWVVITLLALVLYVAPPKLQELTLELPVPLSATRYLGPGTARMHHNLEHRDSAVLNVLRTQKGVVEVVVLSQTEMQRLLKPWLGGQLGPMDLDLPHLMQVKVDVTEPGFTKDALLAHVQRIVPNAAFIEPISWLGALEAVAFRIQFVVVGLLMLFLLVAMAIITFATRTNLLMQHAVIELLTLLGATDRFIAKRFERMTLFVALEALAKALVGVILTVAVVGWIVYDLNQLIIFKVWWHLVTWRVIFLILVPLVIILLMIYSARRCVLHNLEKLF